MEKLEKIENFDDLLQQSTKTLESEPTYSAEYIVLLEERIKFFETVVDESLREMECLPECSRSRKNNKRQLQKDRRKLCEGVRFGVKCGIPIGIELARMEQLEDFLLKQFPAVRPKATFN